MKNDTKWYILLSVSLVVFSAQFGVTYFDRHKVERSTAALECVHSMNMAAPPELAEVPEDQIYAASLSWCNEFIDAAGRK